MTINGLTDRITRLEQRWHALEPEPRIAEEARRIVLTRILALAAVIEPGEVEPGGLDVQAVIDVLARGWQ